MRAICILCVGVMFAAVIAAQDASAVRTTEVDINGHRVTQGPQVFTTQSKTGSETTETVQSINGRTVPLERVEDRVVRDDASGRVVERIIRRYDLTGNPIAPERVVTEENKGPNGSSTVRTTKYAGDINGTTQVIERSTTQKQVSGDSQTADTVIERPTINGSFDAVQKSNTVVIKQPGGYEETAITYRKGPSGFYPAVRKVTDHSENGNVSRDNTAEYEVGATGQLELHGQTVTNILKRSDGSEEIAVDLFSKNVPGVVNDKGSLRLSEHQIIDRRPGAGGAVVETLTIQRPTVSDPNKLGPPKQLSETICRGKCDGQR
jgi:hypothetical protein